MKNQTQDNNITILFNKGIISSSLPTMGGVIIINGVKFDNRDYYSGRGSKYNKSINHEQVVLTITGKELAKAIKHYKMNLKVCKMRGFSNAKNQTKNFDGYYTNTHQYTMTNARKSYYPITKEISRTKI